MSGNSAHSALAQKLKLTLRMINARNGGEWRA